MESGESSPAINSWARLTPKPGQAWSSLVILNVMGYRDLGKLISRTSIFRDVSTSM